MRPLLLLLALVACKKTKPPADAPPPVVVVDGAAAEPDEPSEVDEATVRAGKRTGLESVDSKPEVATEPLIRALLAGEQLWARFVDPAAGVVELRGPEVARRCGVELEQAFGAYSAAALAALADPTSSFDLFCDNAGLTVTIPGVTSHAVCTLSSPSEDGIAYDLVFIPDPARGLRLIGLSSADGRVGDDILDRFDEEMGRYGARCP